MNSMQSRVLVTGISGFVGKNIAFSAAREGFTVRGTVRSPAKRDQTIESLVGAGIDRSSIEIVIADLLDDAGWRDAVSGCQGVFHVASPFPVEAPKDPQELLKPALQGTGKVLKFASEAGVKRTVVTSSTVAISYGHADRTKIHFTEADWSDPKSSLITAYPLSKTLAEKAAWAFAETSDMELVTVNPSFIMGEPLDNDVATSANVISMFLRGRYPAVPKLTFAIVDVRDVAAIHLAAMQVPEAAGNRFIANSGSRTLLQIATTLARAFPERRKKLPAREMPNFAVKLLANFDRTLRSITSELGKPVTFSSDKAQTMLAFKPHHLPDEAIIAMARKVIEFDMA